MNIRIGTIFGHFEHGHGHDPREQELFMHWTRRQIGRSLETQATTPAAVNK